MGSDKGHCLQGYVLDESSEIQYHFLENLP